jgi:hypothetical protein
MRACDDSFFAVLRVPVYALRATAFPVGTEERSSERVRV